MNVKKTFVFVKKNPNLHSSLSGYHFCLSNLSNTLPFQHPLLATRLDRDPLGFTFAQEASLQGAAMAALSPIALSPAQIRRVYNLPSSGGSGTIAIIDAYDDPTVQNDFVTFSNQFGLPTTNLEVHKMTPNIATDSGWALEISLDVQWAHAIAPNAKILLVEATTNSDADLLSAVSYATSRSDVVAVSMSWGGPEFLGQTSLDSYFTSNHGVVFFAATGDSGAGVIWPSSFKKCCCRWRNLFDT